MSSETAKIDPQSASDCLRDIVALSTLPAIWFGAEPLRIAESLAASLFTTLAPEFVYVSFTEPCGGPPVDVAQTERYETSEFVVEQTASAVLEWAQAHDPDELLLLPNPLRSGTVCISTRPLGHRAELGVIAAAFADDNGPSALHHLVLNVAAMQAATAIQNAHLLRSLRESEARFRALVTASAQIVWTASASGAMRDADSWRAFTGQGQDEWRDDGWFNAVHPDDREQVRTLWSRQIAEERDYVHEYRLRRHDGAWRWMTARAVPITAPGGAVREWVGMNTDITEHKVAAETQELLIKELNHRVKNTLATIQAIAQQTLRRSQDRSHFVTAFSGRLQALSSVHTLLTKGVWRSADLRELIDDQVLLGQADENRVQASGPSIALDPQMTLHLALVLHELSTNSRKYGALSAATGRVVVNWTVEDRDLRLQWIEQGGPSVSAPVTTGFGTALIEQSMKAHGGEARVRYEAHGITWTISLPLPKQLAAGPSARAGSASALDSTVAPQVPIAALRPFEGKRVLVVEDEPLVALDLVTSLEDLGIELVGPASTIDQALQLIDTVPVDAALLDANLSGHPVDDLAAALTRRAVPFAFVSGYSRKSLPVAFQNAPLMSKPFSHDKVRDMVTDLVTRGDRKIPAIPIRSRRH